MDDKTIGIDPAIGKEESVEKWVKINRKITIQSDQITVLWNPYDLIVNLVMREGCEDLIPTKSHPNDSGWDMRSPERVVLRPGTITIIKTGVLLEIPPGYEAQVRGRSGLAFKHGICVFNSPGTVDSGYRGEVGVALFNQGEDEFTIERGDRIAQLVFASLPNITLNQVTAMSSSDRGSGGFGSTGR